MATSTGKSRARTKLKLLARGLCSLVFLGIAVWIIDFGELQYLAKRAQAGPFVVAVVFLILSTFICAWRWYAVARIIGLDISYKTASCEYFGCTFFNHVLPGGIMGDVARAWRHSDQQGMTKAAHTVIAERILGQTTFALFIFLAIPTLYLMPGDLHNRHLLVSVFAAIVVAYLVIAFAVLKGKHLPGIVGDKVDEFHDALYDLGLKHAFKMIGISLLMILCFIIGFYFCGRALGLEIPLVLLLGVVPVLKATMMLPISVGGWGFREGAAGGIWALVGLPAAEGVGLSIAYGLAFILASLPGALFWSDLDNEAWRKNGASTPPGNKPEQS